MAGYALVNLLALKEILNFLYHTIHGHELTELFDPFKNRRVSNMWQTWKFNTRKEAEELISVAVLKGYAHKEE